MYLSAGHYSLLFGTSKWQRNKVYQAGDPCGKRSAGGAILQDTPKLVYPFSTRSCTELHTFTAWRESMLTATERMVDPIPWAFRRPRHLLLLLVEFKEILL